MKVIGEGGVHFYKAEDNLPHSYPADAEWWNESVWLNFADPKNGVHGTMRLGHEPNWNGGHAAVWTMIATPNWLYKSDGLYPLRDGDRRADGLSGNDTHYSFEDTVRWAVEKDGLSLDLSVTDHHVPFSFWPAWKNIASNHFEASGSVNGTIELNGERYELVDAPAYRDQSWGIRHWGDLRSHRWVPTTFDADLSCNILAVTDHNANTVAWGYVRRGEEVTICDNVDILTFVEQDGISHRGGTVRYNMPDGDLFEVIYERIGQGALSRQHEVVMNDTACYARHGDMLGGACFETMNNILGGTIVPAQSALTGSIIDNGLWPSRSSSARRVL